MTSEFPNWHIMLIIPIYICNKYQKIGSCRFENDILLYLASVTNASVIYQEIMSHCATFWFKWSQGLGGDSGEKRPRRFFRWFWGFLKEENVFVPVFSLKRFILNCFSKSNHYFQPVLISWVLIAENITKMFHTQQWFYGNSIFQSWIQLKLYCLHN